MASRWAQPGEWARGRVEDGARGEVGTAAPRSALVEVLAVTVSALWIQVLPEAPLSGLPPSRAALPELATSPWWPLLLHLVTSPPLLGLIQGLVEAASCSH